MSEYHLDEMLQQMPKIAKAVNAFSSEEVQRAAFDALIALLLADSPTRNQASKPRSSEKKPKSEKTKATTAKRPRKARSSVAEVKDLDLRPKGKQSFRELAEAKQPKSHQQKCTLAVYYLKNVLKESAVKPGHVQACFLEMQWRLPANLDNALQLTSFKKRWLVTSDMDNIEITASGRNLVDHDLPAKIGKTK